MTRGNTKGRYWVLSSALRSKWYFVICWPRRFQARRCMKPNIAALSRPCLIVGFTLAQGSVIESRLLFLRGILALDARFV